MKRLILRLLLALALALPVQQAVASSAFPAALAQGSSGTLSAANDAVTIAVGGDSYRAAVVRTSATFNGTIQQEFSTDYGVNWQTAPYARLLTTVSANPAITATIVSAAAAAVYEVPLPGNATNFRARATAVTTAGTVFVEPGAVYVPSLPVIAVLYEVTSGTNAALDTGIIDTSGWSSLWWHWTASGAGGSFQRSYVSDTGSIQAILAAVTTTGDVGGWGIGVGVNTASFNTFPLPAPRRMQFTSAAIVGQTTRIRVEARR